MQLVTQFLIALGDSPTDQAAEQAVVEVNETLSRRVHRLERELIDLYDCVKDFDVEIPAPLRDYLEIARLRR